MLMLFFTANILASFLVPTVLEGAKGQRPTLVREKEGGE